MIPYGFEGHIRVDEKDVDGADLWKEPDYVQERVEEMAESAEGDVQHIGILTREGSERLLDTLAPSRHLSPAEQVAYHKKESAKTVAGYRAMRGWDNAWYEEKFGEPYDHEATLEEMRARGYDDRAIGT